MKTQTFHALSKSASLWQIVLRILETQLIVQFVIKESPVDMHLIFEKWISTNSNFGLFPTWILHATQVVKIKFEIDKETDFIDIHFSKWIFQKSSADQQGEW